MHEPSAPDGEPDAAAATSAPESSTEPRMLLVSLRSDTTTDDIAEIIEHIGDLPYVAWVAAFRTGQWTATTEDA